MVDLYQLIMEELIERGCAYVDRYPPFYIASIGAHQINLVNHAQKMEITSGDVADLRLHLIFCAPPGFSKTYWLNQFMRGQHAILANTGIDVTMEASVTGAGFVGTKKFVDGQSEHVMGLAELHSTAIIGIEEFSAVTSMFKASHSGELDNALLLALDSGYVQKRLAAGPIKYRTFITLQTGSQPARFDLSSGLGRRFLIIEFMPTSKDFRILTLARRRARGRRFNPIRLGRIRTELRSLRDKLLNIREIEIDENFYTYMDDCGIKHVEEVLHERFLVGLNVMRGNFKDKGTVMFAEMDSVAKGLLDAEMGWRFNIKRGSDLSQVISIVQDFGGLVEVDDVRMRLLDYGMDFRQAAALIDSMVGMRLIKRKGSKVYLPDLVNDQLEKQKQVV